MVPILLIALFAAAFWDDKPAEQWTDLECRQLLLESPWARQALSSSASPVRVFLATAAPIRLAEAEIAKRKGRQPEDPLHEEYEAYMREGEGRYVVLAVAFPDRAVLGEGPEMRRMEQQCSLRAGGKNYKLTAYFPPSSSDPYLRLAFARPTGAAFKALQFDLYLPAFKDSFRTVEFPLSGLRYRGQPEF